MFTIIAKIWKHVGFKSTSDVTNDDDSSSSSKEDDNFDEDEEEIKEINGKVTGVNKSSRYGIIDGHIFFSYDDVVDSKHPEINSQVVAKIFRKNETDSWKAKSVRLEDEEKMEEEERQEWNNENKRLKKVISVVRSVKDNNYVTTNEAINFTLKDVKMDFVPYCGDVLLITLDCIENAAGEEGQEEEMRVKSVRGMRNHQLEGYITSIHNKGGVIEKKVWYDSSVCRHGYEFRCGDSVVCQVVESNQGGFLWRATLVVPEKPQNSFKVPITNGKCLKIENLLSNKKEIFITHPLTFNNMNLRQMKYITAWIKNEGKKARKLLRCRFVIDENQTNQFEAASQPCLENDSQKQQLLTENEGITIPSGKSAYINLICRATHIGKSEILFVFEFKNFEIGRQVNVNVIENATEELLLPKEKFKIQNNRDSNANKQMAFSESQNGWVIGGQVNFKLRNNLPVYLGSYLIPVKLMDTVLKNEDIFKVAPFLKQELCYKNYSNFFSTLLHLEEIQENLEMREFDLEDVCLQRKMEYLSLTVPGLSEGRPSLMIGDKVYLKAPPGGREEEQERGPTYEGIIHQVLRSEIYLKFHVNFHHSYNGQSHHAAFQCSRTSHRRCHQASSFIVNMSEEVLFPSVKPLNSESLASSKRGQGVPLKWFNSCLNAEQKNAVTQILENVGRPSPYIVFGPPGTGKTITLVEAIQQVFATISSSRILVCAPSNSAADLISERLSKSGVFEETDIVRLNSFSRSEESIPDCIKSICLNGEKICQAAYCRIVISTCVTIGSFYTLGLNAQHFTHAFIDEAGQATEPECCVAMGLVSCGGGQVVLAGDQKQLGPVLRSVLAKSYGLEQSLLERLIKRLPYQRDTQTFEKHGNYNPILVTKLVQNYRSHPAILKLFSDLFYFGELLPFGAKNVTHALESWEKLPNPHFPFIFDGVRGENYRECSSPSWFNPAEVFQVTQYLKSLYESGLIPEDIGIITPYRKQVEKIRFFLNSLEIEQCKIGSVEEFQGQERAAIIISTVRSCPELLNQDLSHNLGFISNPKRFNVAISRAKSLLIVVGDPSLLQHDEHWGALLDYCLENEAYVGCNFERKKP